MVIEIVRQQERRDHQRCRRDREPVEYRRRAPGEQPGTGERADDQCHGQHRCHSEHGTGRNRGGQSGHLLDPERQRYAQVGPGQLRDDDAVVDTPGRRDRERQHRHGESGCHAGQEPGCPPRPGQAQREYDSHRDDRPHLDRPGKAERRAAPGKPSAIGQLVTVEHGNGSGQAAERQPGLQQHGMGGLHAAGIDSQDPAGHDDGGHAAMAHEQPAERHARRARQDGQDPRGGHRPGGAGQLR